MKRYLSMMIAAVLAFGSAVAQDTRPGKEKEDNKLREYDEIIIKRKNGDKDSKVTIEIKDDEVLVDGKPLDDFTDDDIVVRKRGAKRFRLDGGSPFRFDGGAWSLDGDGPYADEDRAFLGVTSEGSTSGAKITSVSDNSAAAKAGLKPGDVITKVDDKAVYDHEQLSEAISNHKPDDKVTITYKRDAKENKATVTLGKRPRRPARPIAPNPPVPPLPFEFDGGDFGDVFMNRGGQPRLGIKVQDTEDGKGVKVLDVEEGSAAEKAGIKKDDVITSFEGKEVTSATELSRSSKEARDKSTLKVQLNRNGKSQTVEVKVPKKLRTATL